MENLKQMARAAKQRMKNNFWEEKEKDFKEGTIQAKMRGLNEVKLKSTLHGKLKNEIKGEKVDEFYLKVKHILETEGEVSDAIGRLTDREYYNTLSYEEKQRYTLDISSKYLRALEKFKKERELSI